MDAGSRIPIEEAAAVQERSPLVRFSFLHKPAVDRTIAVIACLPFLWQLHVRFRQSGFDVPRMVLAIHILAFVIPMLFRRQPVRVTPNPLFWLLAFVVTYWNMIIAGIAEHGRPLLSHAVTGLIALGGLVIMLAARVELGRNIGLVPAQRRIVTGGIYRLMRHPIYTSYFVSVSSMILHSYSLRNAALFSLGILLFGVKSIAEENFLRSDPAYAAYMQRVRWRWFPGIA